jgi:ABC-type spermidine/putrescine transport system permease subunit I
VSAVASSAARSGAGSRLSKPFGLIVTGIERLTPLLPLAWLGAFFVAPLGFTVVYAFADSTFGGVKLAFTLTNFQQALSGFYLHIFLHTLVFAAMGTAGALIIGMPLAYVLGRKAGRYRTVLAVAVLIPFWTSFLLRTLSWETLLAGGGPVQAILNFLGLHSGELGWIDTNKAVAVGLVYAYLPLMVIPLFVAFDRIPADVLEASKDLGANRLKTFLYVTLPIARPGVFTAILLTFVPMTGEFVVPALLGGDKGVLMGGLIYSQYLGAANYPLGSAMAVLVMLVIGIVLIAFSRLTRGFDQMGAAA